MQEMERVTKETKIRCSIDKDGTGQGIINTGIEQS